MDTAVDIKTRAKARTLCAQLLGAKWTLCASDDGLFDIQVITGGRSNRLYKCSIRDEAGDLSESVLFRLYGTEEVPREFQSPEATLIAIFSSLSFNDLGPKLLGVFDGGRIEQFIPSRTLNRDEIRTDEVNSIVARKICRLHTLNMPINKEPINAMAAATNMFEQFSKKKAQVIAKVLPKDNDLAVELIQEDFAKEITWTTDVGSKIKHKTVFCHQDLHLHNILVRLHDDNNNGQSVICDENVLVIDFDACRYNHRGTDIGSHFFHRAFDFSKANTVVNDGIATDEEKTVFVSEYFNELLKLTEKSNIDLELDTEEHLMLEANFYELAICLITLSWVLLNRDPGDDGFHMWGLVRHCKEIYEARKEQFIAKYPHLVGSNDLAR